MDLTRTVVFAAALLLFMLSLGYAFAEPAAPNTPPTKEVQPARDKASDHPALRARAAQKTTRTRVTATRRFTT